MTAVEDVKLKLDIVQVIGQYTTLSKAGRLYRAPCPFHSEKDPSFYVYPDQQTWHCFGACATGGDVFSFVMKKEGIDFKDALQRLADQAGVILPTYAPQSEKKEVKDPLYTANAAAAQYFYDYLLTSPSAKKIREYVEGRGITRKSIENFQIGMSPENDGLKQYLVGKGFDEKTLIDAGLLIQGEDGRVFDRFHGRLMFPIRDIKGQTTGFGARAMDDSQPKYKNSPQTTIFDKSGTLYAVDAAAPAIRKADMAIIVEGYVDAIMLHQNGVNNVIASMGTSITDKQINILKKMTKNLVLALDPDVAGEEAMLRCVTYEALTGSEIKVMSLPQGIDPDEVIRDTPEVWHKAVTDARPVMDCTFDSLLAGLDITKAGDKQMAVDRLLPVIGGINNPIRQAHYTQKLARKVNVRETVLEAEMARAKKQVQRKKGETPGDVVSAPVVKDPLEEYFLALLVQHPELQTKCNDVLPEYLLSAENREILNICRKAQDPVPDEVANAVSEHLARLKAQSIPPGPIEERFQSCLLRLRERYVRNIEARRGEILAVEAETGAGADLARLQADGIQNSLKLREIHKTLGKR